jgi:hypothetical protein
MFDDCNSDYVMIVILCDDCDFVPGQTDKATDKATLKLTKPN